LARRLAGLGAAYLGAEALFVAADGFLSDGLLTGVYFAKAFRDLLFFGVFEVS